MHFIDRVLDLVYPPVCGFCGKIDSKFLCDGCRDNLVMVKDCRVVKKFKDSCFFRELFYLFSYEGEIRRKIIEYKFWEKPYLYRTWAQLFIEDTFFSKFIGKYDCITCVPLSKKRWKSRGYNQSELVAKEIAKFFGIPYLDNVLIKQKNIAPQSSLNKEQRKSNILNAFSLNYSHGLTTPFENLAIFDDIFTTRCNYK